MNLAAIFLLCLIQIYFAQSIKSIKIIFFINDYKDNQRLSKQNTIRQKQVQSFSIDSQKLKLRIYLVLDLIYSKSYTLKQDLNQQLKLQQKDYYQEFQHEFDVTKKKIVDTLRISYQSKIQTFSQSYKHKQKINLEHNEALLSRRVYQNLFKKQQQQSINLDYRIVNQFNNSKFDSNQSLFLFIFTKRNNIQIIKNSEIMKNYHSIIGLKIKQILMNGKKQDLFFFITYENIKFEDNGLCRFGFAQFKPQDLDIIKKQMKFQPFFLQFLFSMRLKITSAKRKEIKLQKIQKGQYHVNYYYYNYHFLTQIIKKAKSISPFFIQVENNLTYKQASMFDCLFKNIKIIRIKQKQLSLQPLTLMKFQNIECLQINIRNIRSLKSLRKLLYSQRVKIQLIQTVYPSQKVPELRRFIDQQEIQFLSQCSRPIQQDQNLFGLYEKIIHTDVVNMIKLRNTFKLMYRYRIKNYILSLKKQLKWWFILYLSKVE